MKTNHFLIALLAVCLLGACEKQIEPATVLNETTHLSTQQVNDETNLAEIQAIDATNLTAQQTTNADGDNLSLTNVKWKLVAFVEIATSTVKTPIPYDNNSYLLEFYDNDSLSGISSTNLLAGSYSINILTNNYATDSKQSPIRITELGGTKINELYDGKLFTESLLVVESYTISGDELKLYYNNNQNYLLFKTF